MPVTVENEIPIISIKGLSKRYGSGPLVLDDITIEAKKGEFISLIGPSGCGKSTLLKSVCGLTPFDEGSLTVDGMSPKNARELSFFVFQDANLLPWLDVLANVELPLELKGVSKERRRKKALEMIKLVGLAEATSKLPRQLSGGMQMRVSIARALSVSPRVLLLDEPFGALDDMTRNRLNEDLLKIRETDSFTSLFVTHSVAEAVFLSNRIVILSANPGRISKIIEVPFAFPRDARLRESLPYLELLAETTRALRSVEES